MAELQLVGLGPAGQAQELMPQADAEDRLLAQQVADGLLRVVQRLGIAGTVGEEHAVGLLLQDLGGRGRARQDGHPAAHVEEVAGDVPLHAVVQAPRRAARNWKPAAPAVPSSRAQRLSGSFHWIGPSGMTSRTRSRPTSPGLALAFSTSRASSRSVLESTPFIAPRIRSRRTSARVSMPSMRHDAVADQVAVQVAFGAEVAHQPALLADDEAGQLRLGALHVRGVDPVVADLGIGHGDDLSAIAGIGEDLLVSGHGGVEADLAVDLAGGAEGPAGEDGAVFQGEFCDWRHRNLSSIPGIAVLKSVRRIGPIADVKAVGL